MFSFTKPLCGISFLLASNFFSPVSFAIEIGACKFNVDTQTFKGDAVEQAACLLRQVRKWGNIDPTSASIPDELASIIGKPTSDLRSQLRSVLKTHSISENSIGGNLDNPISRAANNQAQAPFARYFVIHDTSAPWLKDAKSFPPDDSKELNKLSAYGGPDAVAHVFVNRIGETLLGHDFSVPWRATKLEKSGYGGEATKGLFLHIELLQPRRRDPAGGPKNDAISPTPGFTSAQYDKLAILYTAASIRSGTWLIPAYHAAIDENLSDAHDDPQQFELKKFSEAVTNLRVRLAAT